VQKVKGKGHGARRCRSACCVTALAFACMQLVCLAPTFNICFNTILHKPWYEQVCKRTYNKIDNRPTDQTANYEFCKYLIIKITSNFKGWLV